MNEKFKLIAKVLGSERVKFNENLSYYVYSRRGGPADCLYIATNRNELIGILNLVHQLKIPFMILGGGTKVLINKDGLKCLVIKNRSSNIKIAGIKGKVARAGIGIEELQLDVESGVSMGKLNDFLIKQGLEKVIGFSSSYSSVGGSIFLDPNLLKRTDRIKIWDNGEVFDIPKTHLKRSQIVVAVTFKFRTKKDLKEV